MTPPSTPRFLLAAAAAIVLAGTTSASAHAQSTTPAEEIVFSLSPAQTEDQPDDRVSIRTEIAPGDSYEDAVTLRNHTENPVTFQLAAADGITSESGAFDVLSPGAESEAAGTWFELEHDVITIEPEDEATVDFTVTVPDNATPGDHPAGITAALAEQDEQLNVVSRAGVRTHLRVSGDIAPTLAFDNISTTYTPSWNPFAPGTVTTSYSLTNTGNVRLGADTTVATSGIFGWNSTSAAAGEVHEILPGDTVSFETVNDQVWPLIYGTVNLEAVPQIVGDDQVEVELVSATQSQPVALVSISWGIVLILLLVGLAYVIWQRKRRAKKFDDAVAAAAKQQRLEEAVGTKN